LRFLNQCNPPPCGHNKNNFFPIKDIYTLPHTSNEIWTFNPFMEFALLNDNPIEATKEA